MVNNISPRDVFVNVVARAIRTGVKDPRGAARNAHFYEGRVSGFVVSAADLAHMAYGVDPHDARKRISSLVKDVRLSWEREDKMDAAKVGAEAEVILEQILLLPAGRL